MRINYTKAVAATFEEAVRQQEQQTPPPAAKIPDVWQRELYERLEAGSYGRGSWLGMDARRRPSLKPATSLRHRTGPSR
jgi:hypothetical protein